MEHIDIPIGNIHPAHNWEYADAASRTAAVITDATLLKRLAVQLDAGTLWLLTGVAPAVWLQVGGGSGGGGGNSVLNGSGAPASGLGNDGDFYIDTTMYQIYGPKTAGAWGGGVPLVGPQGPTGATGANGVDGKTIYSSAGGPPASGLGVNGDYCIDYVNWTIYGPKASGAWPAGVSMIGPAGGGGGSPLTVSSQGVNVDTAVTLLDFSGTGVTVTHTAGGQASVVIPAATKTSVGLPNADNTSDVNKPVSTAQAAADTNTLNSAKTYADGLVVGLWDDRGSYDASSNVFPSTGGSGTSGAVLKGDIWTITVGGTLGGVGVVVGQNVRALIDAPGQTLANWALGVGSSGSALIVQDEGVTITGAASTMNFVGGGVTAAAVGNVVTVTIAAATAASVGLPNVDNTSDVNKPVSTAQATVIALKEPVITAGTASQYYRGDKTMQTLDKTAVGLQNVDNTSDVNKPVSTAQAAANTTTLASAKTYSDSLVVGLWDDRGNYDASSNVFPSTGGSGTSGAVLKGDIWTISVAGTLGGTAVVALQTVRAMVDAPGQTSASWAISIAGTAAIDNSITAGVTGRAPSQDAVYQALALKEPTITAGTTAQYLRGNKTLSTFATDVLAAVLTGLSTATNSAALATDTILVGIGKLQAQVSAINILGTALTGLSTATNAVVTATDTILVGIGKLQKQFSDFLAQKAASGGLASMTLFKINLPNDANTFVSTLNNTNTAARAYTLPDRNGNLATQELAQNSQSVAYTTVLADAGMMIYHPSADTTARVFTIPANSSVAYPIGTALTFVNDNAAGAVTISIATDTMRLAGTGATGSRTLSANGIATALKLTATTWIISGMGLA